MQNLPVTICLDRAGIVGNDGETHHGIFDLSFTSSIPNLVVLAPKNFDELEKMLEFAIKVKKPTIIRYPRGGEENIEFEKVKRIDLGKSEIIRQGTGISIIAIGKMVSRAVKVADILKEQGIDAEIINARFLKPLDEKRILESIKKTTKVVTIEDNLLKGGLGSQVIELINKNKLENIHVQTFGYDDCFVEHGKTEELEKKYKMDAESIASIILNKEEKAIKNIKKS